MSKNKSNKNKSPRDELADQLLDQLLSEVGTDPEKIIGKDGLLKQLTKRLVEKAMEREMTDHIGYEKHASQGNNTGNSRNGQSSKTIKGDFGEVEIETPRDRNTSFEPQIIKKNQTHFKGFDDKIISMYTRGMPVREIQGHLKEQYGVDVSPDLISNVTNAVLEDVKEWQNRSLDRVYPILYLDAVRMKIRDEGHVQNKAVYVVLGVNMDGKKKVLGLWVQQTEGAKFWLRVITDLKNRGVEDIFIACVDGLKGFPDAINSVFPETQVQLCIVHMIRHSLKFVSYKERKVMAADLKLVYTAVSAKQGMIELENFGKKYDNKYPTISRSWKNNWENIQPFFAYPPEIRKAIYTTNAIESLNYSFKKITKIRGSFPNDDSAIKLMYLGLSKISKKWTMPIRDWGAAINQFAIIFGDRVPIYES